MWDFDHPPQAATLEERYQVESMMPAQCAERLAAGSADLGLVPTVAFAENPALRIVPGCAIASKGPIRSLLLVYRRSPGREAIRTIAADTSSRATLAYLQIIARHYWRLPARFLAHAPNLDSMLAAADAALLIGDPALLALEDRDAREARSCEELVYLDLGAEWRDLTGLPWISAVWGIRAEARDGTGSGTARSPDKLVIDRLIRDLNASRDAGLSHIDDLADEWAARIAVPRATIHTYLSRNIFYALDEECLEGLRRFYALAAECHVLPSLPQLPML
jgi:chorismate dehydratase